MSNNLLHCLEKLKKVSSIKNVKQRQKQLDKISDACIYKALNEIAIYTIEGSIKLSPQRLKKLRKFNRNIKKMSTKTNNRTEQKKLVKQSGGFLPILIPAVASIITSLITK